MTFSIACSLVVLVLGTNLPLAWLLWSLSQHYSAALRRAAEQNEALQSKLWAAEITRRPDAQAVAGLAAGLVESAASARRHVDPEDPREDLGQREMDLLNRMS